MDNGSKDTPGAFLPLPAGDAKPAKKTGSSEPAVELIRKKVAAAYSDEPDVIEEEKDIEELGPALKPSKHQEFIQRITNSGKSLDHVQQEWRDYYAGLNDTEKHQVWREFYTVHAQASHFSASAPSMAPGETHIQRVSKGSPRTSVKIRELAGPHSPTKTRHSRPEVTARTHAKRHLKSLAFGIGMGCLALLIVMFSFFNERFIAPLIQPSRDVSNLPLIDTNTVDYAPEIIIPKINVEIPVIYGVDSIDNTVVENALKNGVVHYADTALPGQKGNLVIIGHSSSNIFTSGGYKFAFALLPRLEVGDTFYLQKDGKRYTYQVYEKKVVPPTDVSVLGTTDKPATATLISCYPPGSSANRIVVIGQQISPDPATDIAASGQNSLATSATFVPSNAPSLWSRLWSWL